MALRYLSVVLGCVALVACATAQPVWVPPPPPPPLPPLPPATLGPHDAVEMGTNGVCRGTVVGGLIVGRELPFVRQGGVYQLSLEQSNAPAGFRRVSAECVTGWTVSPDGAGQVSPDGQLVVADQAPAGQYLVLSATYAGARTETRVRVLGLDEVTLAGTWTHSGGDCGGDLPPPRTVGELVLGVDGRIAVTFQPFETYVDYWGVYESSPPSERFAFDVTGGNARPINVVSRPEAREGTARLEGNDRLVLEGFDFSGDAGPQTRECTYVFARIA